MLETILEPFMTVILPAAIASVVSWLRGLIDRVIPSRYIPVLLSVVGGLVGAGASLLEVPIGPIVDMSTLEAALRGVMVGLTAVGVHQLVSRIRSAA